MTAATAEQQSANPQDGPSNIDAERSVLGSILLDPGVMPAVHDELPDPAMFSLSAHQTIYTTLLAMSAESVEPSLVSLSDWLRRGGQLDAVGGYMTLAGLEQFVVATSSAVDHARIIRAAWEHRQLITISRSAAVDARGASLPSTDIVERACREFMGVVDRTGTAGRFVTNEELMQIAVEQAHAAADARHRGEVIGVPSGLADQDKLIGGFADSSLIVLAARPSIGKTAAAINLYRNLANNGELAAFFSLEMGRGPIAMRIACAEAGISCDKVSKGYASQHELARLREAASDIAERPGLLSDCSHLSGVHLLMKAKLLKAQRPELRLIIVDGLWLMDHPSTPGMNQAQRVGKTVHLVKQAAKETGVPILLLHQLNRSSEQRASKRDLSSGKGDRPILSDLRETGDVEQDADVVMFLHRERRELVKAGEDVKGHEDTPAEEGADETGGWDDGPENRNDPGFAYRLERAGEASPMLVPTDIIVAKNRNGPTGTVTAMFDLVTQRWSDRARER